SRSVSRLQILERHAATTSRLSFGLLVLVVNEGDERFEIGGAKRERRHARVDASIANHRYELVAADIIFHQQRAREVRSCLAARRVPSVTKTPAPGRPRVA